MKLGLFLPLGGSLKDMAATGQDSRFIRYYLKPYSQNFSEVSIYSYEKELPKGLPRKVTLIANKLKLHRYLYGPLLKFYQPKVGSEDIFRCFQLTGALPALLPRLMLGKKFVMNCNYDHIAWAKVDGKPYLVPFIYILEIIAFSLAEVILVPNVQMKRRIGLFGKKAVLLPNGVDTNEFAPSKKQKKKRTFVLLSVGRLEQQKNFPLLLNAVGLSKYKDQITVQLVGTGSQEKDLKALAKKNKIKLEIVPRVPHNKLPKYYQEASLYIQTSHMESAAKTILEAKSTALPCLGVNSPGVKEMLKHGKTGWVVNPSEKEVAVAIDYLLARKTLRHTLGAKARDEVKKHFDINSTVQKEIKILKSLC